MKILVTGTPGVGKTTFSKRLAKALNILHLDVAEFIRNEQAYEHHDMIYDSHIFSPAKVGKKIHAFLKEYTSFIIDTHSPTVAEGIDFDVIVLMQCSTNILCKRLEKRDYSEKKIEENIECEIFQVIRDDLEECFEKDFIIVHTGDRNEDDEGIDADEAYSHILGLTRNYGYGDEMKENISLETSNKK